MSDVRSLIQNLIQSQRMLLNTLEQVLAPRSPAVKDFVLKLSNDIFGNKTSPIQGLMDQAFTTPSQLLGGDESGG